MQELEPTLSRALRVWWLFMWRGTLGSILIGAAAGVVLGIVGTLVGLPQTSIAVVGAILGACIGIGWSIIVMRMALLKRYNEEFRLARSRTPNIDAHHLRAPPERSDGAFLFSRFERADVQRALARARGRQGRPFVRDQRTIQTPPFQNPWPSCSRHLKCSSHPTSNYRGECGCHVQACRNRLCL